MRNFRYLVPWLRSDIRLRGRFAVQWLQGFERVPGAGEELSGYGLVATFAQEPSNRPLRVLIDVDGRKLSARILLQQSEPANAQFRCSFKFVAMGRRERRELNEVLETAPAPRYTRERIERPERAARALAVAPETEARIVTALVHLKRLARPDGPKRPLLAIKAESDVTEDGVEGKQYRVRSRFVDSHGVTKTFDTDVFVPVKGEARALL